jgi:ATP-dependent DNA helicase RecG
MAFLPVAVHDLILGRVIENERIEYKKGWDPLDIMRTLCAFANDINNIGGGYIVVGNEEDEGQPILPPFGVAPSEIDKFQKKLLEISKAIQSNYSPVAFTEEYQGQLVFIIRAAGGDLRPYKCPNAIKGATHRLAYIRRYSSTIQATAEDERILYELAAKVPFDDRINHHANLTDLNRTLIQTHLKEIKSEYNDVLPFNLADICISLEGGVFK